MNWFKRIFLFLLVNLAIIVLLSTLVSIFGLDIHYLKPNGLDLKALFIFAAIIGFSGSFISLLISRKMAVWTTRAQRLDVEDCLMGKNSKSEQFLCRIINTLAKQNNIACPQVALYPSAEVNAFATGWGRNHSLVAVSAGMLQQMNEEEIEGVLAHEMAHIVNGDMVTMTLLQGVLNTFVIFMARAGAFAIQKTLGRDNQEIGGLSYWILSIALEITFGVLAMVVLMAFSRHREFRADYGSAQMVGKRKMIAALQRLQSLHEVPSSGLNKNFANLKISGRSRWKALASHPPLADRIAALQHAPLV